MSSWQWGAVYVLMGVVTAWTVRPARGSRYGPREVALMGLLWPLTAVAIIAVFGFNVGGGRTEGMARARELRANHPDPSQAGRGERGGVS